MFVRVNADQKIKLACTYAVSPSNSWRLITQIIHIHDGSIAIAVKQNPTLSLIILCNRSHHNENMMKEILLFCIHNQQPMFPKKKVNYISYQQLSWFFMLLKILNRPLYSFGISQPPPLPPTPTLTPKSQSEPDKLLDYFQSFELNGTIRSWKDII